MMNFNEVMNRIAEMALNGNGFSYIEYLKLTFSNPITGMMYTGSVAIAVVLTLLCVNYTAYVVKEIKNEIEG